MSDTDLIINGTTQIKMVLSRIRRQFSRALSSLFGTEGKARVGIYGPPNAGKCLTPDEKVLLSDGRSMRIDEIFEKIKKAGGKEMSQNSKEKWIESNLDLKVPSISNDLDIQEKKISHGFRQEYKGKMYKIQTELGREITVSPDHPFITESENKAEKRKAKNLKKNQRIALLSKFDPNLDKNKKIEKDISTDGGRIKSLKPANKKENLQSLNTDIYLRFLGFLISRYTEKNKSICFFHEDPQIVQEFKHISREIGIDIKLDERSKESTIFLNKENISENLPGFGGKTVPDFLFRSDKSSIQTFLKAVFECNGELIERGSGVEKQEIDLFHNSREVVSEIQLLLLRFGIKGKLKQTEDKFKLSFKGEDKRILKKVIGISEDIDLPEDKNTVSISTLDIFDTNSLDDFSFCNETEEVSWDRVSKIEKIDYEGYIYDLTVEENHTFTTQEGLIVHNTTLANRISKDWTGETVGSESQVPHETRKAQKKKDITIESNGASLNLDIVDTPGVATKVDYEDFLEYGLHEEDAVRRSREATEGVAEAMGWLKEDLDGVVYVLDSTLDPFTQVNTMLIGIIESRDLPVLVAANKIDLEEASSKRVEEAFPQHETVGLSALEGDNIEELYEKMAEKFV